jgi:hypothetical protein
VCHSEAVLDAPVCTDVPCDSWFDGPPKFAVTVTQWPGQWIVAYSIELADIDSFAGTAPHADEYRVLAHSGAVEAGGVWEEDHAPGGPEAWLIVPGSSGLAGSPRAPVARVTLRGSPFFDRAADEADMRWGMGLIVSPDSLVDGGFFDRSRQWDEGAVWWAEGPEGGAMDRWIEIDLRGAYTIDSAIVQADDNDSYLLSYRDLETGAWEELWTIPVAGGFGMQTRPNPSDGTERQTLAHPVTTDTLRFEALEGDGLYSVSEIQVFGHPSDGS